MNRKARVKGCRVLGDCWFDYGAVTIEQAAKEHARCADVDGAFVSGDVIEVTEDGSNIVHELTVTRVVEYHVSGLRWQ